MKTILISETKKNIVITVHMEMWGSRPGTVVNGAWTSVTVAVKTQVMGLQEDGVPVENSY